ncbi:MAG TPA: hypothetical protein DEQ52_01010 [Ruminococcaceae bacterium]|nr:hypothetical protein [Oscillospiraceae bacterium]
MRRVAAPYKFHINKIVQTSRADNISFGKVVMISNITAVDRRRYLYPQIPIRLTLTAISSPSPPASIYILGKMCYNAGRKTPGRDNKMIRLASVGDAAELELLNAEFNGRGEATAESIRTSLLTNRHEVVVVADGESGRLAGFVCVQLKKSFCCEDFMPEITEVYVRPDYRRRGIARKMLTFAQEYCKKIYPLHSFELLTGSDNTAAKKLYSALGFEYDGEVHMAKHAE